MLLTWSFGSASDKSKLAERDRKRRNGGGLMPGSPMPFTSPNANQRQAIYRSMRNSLSTLQGKHTAISSSTIDRCRHLSCIEFCRCRCYSTLQGLLQHTFRVNITPQNIKDSAASNFSLRTFFVANHRPIHVEQPQTLCHTEKVK